MSDHRPGHLTSGWLAHLVAAACVVTIAIVLGAPRADVPQVARGQERGIEELAALLGEPSPQPAMIEENLRGWTRFPPSEPDGRQLTVAVAGCSMAGLPASTRVELARRLYVITNGSDVRDADLARTLDMFQRAAARAGCQPEATLRLLEALRWTARHDPRPRADWW